MKPLLLISLHLRICDRYCRGWSSRIHCADNQRIGRRKTQQTKQSAARISKLLVTRCRVEVAQFSGLTNTRRIQNGLDQRLSGEAEWHRTPCREGNI